MRFIVPVVVVALLAACSGGSGKDNSVDVVCAEQAALAQNGTVDGGKITITCPN